MGNLNCALNSSSCDGESLTGAVGQLGGILTIS